MKKISLRSLLVSVLFVAVTVTYDPQKAAGEDDWQKQFQRKGDLGAAPSAATEAARKNLQEKLNEAGAFRENEYSIATWNPLRAVMEKAQQLADKPDATSVELQRALAGLQQRITAMEKRQPLPEDNSPRIGLSASLFATDRKGPVNNVALMWATADPGESFEILRSTGKDGDFTKIYSGQGASFNDYGLKDGTYSYKLVAHRGGETLASNVEQITTMAMPEGVEEFSNQTDEGRPPLGGPMKIGDTYYGFPSERDGKALKAMWVETSKDGKNWKRGRVVMDRTSHPDLEDYKFESGSMFYNKDLNKIVWWCHWEKADGYAHGRAFVATATPGEPFTVHHIYNPLGVAVRDMSIFVDDDKQGYLVAAGNVFGQGANATLYIFKLNEDFTDVTGVTNKVMEEGYREAPHIVKEGGFYYVFFSQAAGWFPSRAGYVSGKSLDGGWSDVRYMANTSTFSSQSGPIQEYGKAGHPTRFFTGYRWVRGEGTAGTVVAPIHFAEGFAFADYSPTLLVEPEKSVMIPLNAGKLLSEDQPASSSIPGRKDHEVEKAFDGNYETFFEGEGENRWPFSVTTDLGSVCKVRNVQISWHIHKGSEAYYKYIIEGSLDGKEWRTLMDRTDDKDTVVSKSYGFTSDMLPDAPEARYVRVNVQNAVLHNNPNNWYPPMLYEVKVYGDRATRTESAGG